MTLRAIKRFPESGDFYTVFSEVFIHPQTGQLADKAKDFFQDLEGELENLMDLFEGRPGAVKAWEKLFTKSSWRTNTTYLSKVSRYTDNGLDIVEEGGKLVVKQNGVKVGKLDPNDPYNPGEMKVEGDISKRHFDPDEAGGPIIKKSWANPNITQEGIDDVTTHLSRFGSNSDNANMIQRLQDIKDGNIPITDYDKRFYTHELEEYARYKNLGVPDGVNPPGVWDNTHAASLEVYNINETLHPLYHP